MGLCSRPGGEGHVWKHSGTQLDLGSGSLASQDSLSLSLSLSLSSLTHNQLFAGLLTDYACLFRSLFLCSLFLIDCQ
jgi:hypothetical protein